MSDPNQQNQNRNGNRPPMPGVTASDAAGLAKPRDVSRFRPVAIRCSGGISFGAKTATMIVTGTPNGVRPPSEVSAREMHWHPLGVLIVREEGTYVIPAGPGIVITVAE